MSLPYIPHTKPQGMKITCFFLIILLFSSCGLRKHHYNISGQIQGLENETIYLSNKGNGVSQASKIVLHDSTKSNNGYFQFHKKYEDTDFFSIEVPSRSTGWLTFVAPRQTDSPIVITGHIDSLYRAKIEGNPAQEDFVTYRKNLDRCFIDPYMEIVEQRDKIPSYKDSLDLINKKMGEFFIETSQREPDNYAVLYSTYSNQPVLTRTTMQVVYKNLSNRLQKKEYGRMLLNTAYPYVAGDKFEPVRLQDTSARTTKLNPKSGHYMLLDFWASWCIPCIHEIPTLKRWYDGTDPANFEIIGISLDTNIDSWKNALQEYEIPWKQLSDLNGNMGFLFTKFSFLMIPQKVLLSPEGKILCITSDMKKIERFLIKERLVSNL